MTSKQKVKISSVLRNITAIVVSAVILTLVWPHLPRSTELAQGCTVTTAGTIATIYGNLYAAVARLGGIGGVVLRTDFYTCWSGLPVHKHVSSGDQVPRAPY